MTADENENQPRELKFGEDITNRVYMKIPVKFYSYQLLSAVNSWSQLITVEYKKQSKKLKFGTYITLIMYMKISVNFFGILTADTSCDNDNQPRELIFGTFW